MRHNFNDNMIAFQNIHNKNNFVLFSRFNLIIIIIIIITTTNYDLTTTERVERTNWRLKCFHRIKCVFKHVSIHSRQFEMIPLCCEVHLKNNDTKHTCRVVLLFLLGGKVKIKKTHKTSISCKFIHNFDFDIKIINI